MEIQLKNQPLFWSSHFQIDPDQVGFFGTLTRHLLSSAKLIPTFQSYNSSLVVSMEAISIQTHPLGYFTFLSSTVGIRITEPFE